MKPELANHDRRQSAIGHVPLTSAANLTKWMELRAAMIALEAPRPEYVWTALDATSGRDHDWHWHFHGGLQDLHYIDLIPHSDDQADKLREILAKIGLAGHVVDRGYRIYGYLKPGETAEHFKL